MEASVTSRRYFVLVLLFLNWFLRSIATQALCGSTKSPFVDVHLHLPVGQFSRLEMSREITLLKSKSANNLQCSSPSAKNQNNKRPSVRTRPSNSVKAIQNRPSTGGHIVRKNSSRNKGRKHQHCV